MFPFWVGISTPNPIHYNEEENKRIFEAQQQQRKLERDMRMLKKEKACADAIGDTETSEMLQGKIERKSNEINAWCNANGLKRDYSRELVQEQISKNSFTKDNKISYNTITENYEPITENTISNVPQIEIEELSSEQNAILQDARRQVLISAKGETTGIECANTILLESNRLLQSEIGEIGTVNISNHNEWYYSVHNHPDNGVISPGDIMAFNKRPYMLGIESVSNNGKLVCALVKTNKCTLENVAKYQSYLEKCLVEFKQKFGDLSKLDFETLNNFSKKILSEANNYGYKYYTKSR